MSCNLIAEQVGERRPERPVHLTDCDFRLGRCSRRATGDEGLSYANANSICSFQLILCGHR